MKKSAKSLLTFAVVSLFAAGLAFAGADKVKSENKVAGCCAKAAKAGESCKHECCVAAAKDGKNCTKCGGAGMVKKAKKKKAN